MWPIFFVRLYLSKSPHSIWGSVAPLPCEVRSAQDLVPPRGDYLNYRWKKNPTRGYKVKRPAPIYAGVRRYKVLSAPTSQGMGVGSPPPVQGDLLKYRWKIKNIQDGNSLRIHSVSFSVVSAQTESAASIPFPKSQGSLSGQSPLLRLIKCRSKLISLLLPTLFLDLLFCQNHFLFNLNIPHKKSIAITIVWDAVQCWSVSPHVKASHGIYLKWLVIQHNIIRTK